METLDAPGLFVYSSSLLRSLPWRTLGTQRFATVLCHDDILNMASEVGSVEPPPHVIKPKGRLQPGRVLWLDTCKWGTWFRYAWATHVSNTSLDFLPGLFRRLKAPASDPRPRHLHHLHFLIQSLWARKAWSRRRPHLQV